MLIAFLLIKKKGPKVIRETKVGIGQKDFEH